MTMKVGRLYSVFAMLLACATLGGNPASAQWELKYHRDTHRWMRDFDGDKLSYEKLCNGELEAPAEVRNRPYLLEAIAAGRFVLDELNAEDTLCAGHESGKSEAEHLGALLGVLGEFIQTPDPSMGESEILEITKRRANGSPHGRHFATIVYLNLLETYKDKHPALVVDASKIFYYMARHDAQTRIRRMALIGYMSYRNDNTLIKRLLQNVAERDGENTFDGRFTFVDGEPKAEYEFRKGFENGKPLIKWSAISEYSKEAHPYVNYRTQAIKLSPATAKRTDDGKEPPAMDIPEIVVELNKTRLDLISQLEALKTIYQNPDAPEVAASFAGIEAEIDRKINRSVDFLDWFEGNLIVPYNNQYPQDTSLKGEELCDYIHSPDQIITRRIQRIQSNCEMIETERELKAEVQEMAKSPDLKQEILDSMIANIDRALENLKTPATEKSVRLGDGYFYYVRRVLKNNVTWILAKNTRRFAKQVQGNYNSVVGDMCSALEFAEQGNSREDLDLTFGTMGRDSADIMFSIDSERGECGRP